MSTIDGNGANTPYDTVSVPPKQEAPDFPRSSPTTENDVGGNANGHQHSQLEQPTHPLRKCVYFQSTILKPPVTTEQASGLASPSSSGTATIGSQFHCSIPFTAS